MKLYVIECKDRNTKQKFRPLNANDKERDARRLLKIFKQDFEEESEFRLVVFEATPERVIK